MTKYRVISRVLCDVGESCTFYFPQRKALLGWKNIKQNGETVKFRDIYEAFRFVDGDPLTTNVVQRPSKLSNHLDCWVYHFTARTTEKDLSAFLESVFEDVSVWRHHELMIISMPISGGFRSYFPVRPGDCVVLYPNGQVYVVPDVDEFPVSVLSTK